MLFVTQGTLDAPTDVTVSDNQISWSAPYSLDITNVDPDIVYCVSIANYTCGSENPVLIIDDCNVTETKFIFNIPDDGGIYQYNITSRSNVLDSNNGRSTTITGNERYIQCHAFKREWELKAR